jgi:hypothetical protein
MKIASLFSQLMSANSVAVLGFSVLLVAGCTTSSQNRAEQTVNSIQNVQDRLKGGTEQVDKVLAAMNALPGSGDNLKTAFGTFSTEVDNTLSHAQTTDSVIKDMDDHEAAYVQQWQTEVGTIADPTLKSTADAREQAVKNHFDEIQAKLAATRDAYKIFSDDLTGLRTYLAPELTIDAVGDAHATIAKTNTDGATLKAKIADASNTISAVQQTLPGVPAPQPADNSSR